MHLIHDLRIALLVIASCVEALKNRTDTESLQRELRLIRQLLETSFAIIHELLVSRELRTPPVDVDVDGLLTDLDDVLRTMVGPDVTVRTSLASCWSRVAARRVDLERIVLNLVQNAAAAMTAGDVLSIETSSGGPDDCPDCGDAKAPAGMLRLTVGDTGRGMSEPELQAVNTTSPHPLADGTGIGLACVSLIVARLGGTLHIGSREGKGTVVGVVLPLTVSHDQVH